MTSTSKHTPGPWNTRIEKRTRLICDANGNQIAAIRPVSRYGIDGDDAANARLIAAAPFLLQTLETIALHAPSLDAAGIREYCDAAIAKAGGRS